MIYSSLQKRPNLSYLLLGLVFVVWVSGMALAESEAFPDGYDWILGCLLFGTTLAWMGAAALVGAVAPVNNTVMKYAYGALAVFLLGFVIYVIAVGILDVNPGSYYPGHSSLRFEATLWAWMALVGLVGSLAPRNIKGWVYVPLVATPLFTGIVYAAFLLLAWSVSLMDSDKLPFEFALVVTFGLPVFLLYRAFLSRLIWLNSLLRSNLRFILVAVSTVALVTLDLWFVLMGSSLRITALVGLVVFLAFGVPLLWNRDKHNFRAAVLALGIAMASYWLIVLVASMVLIFITPWWVGFSLPFTGGIVISVAAGYLISEVRHPWRNVLVATIGPGLLMMMLMCFYLFSPLQKGI
ncbi:MAG: hypothetical protein F4X94_08765 [Dehalococcoidia bacterium]|nr:hypothetical protein [Dehalococcoidia bacterium]